MKNVKDLIDQIKNDHAKMEANTLSSSHASVKARNYGTICKVYADKVKHDKHYGINDPAKFYDT